VTFLKNGIMPRSDATPIRLLLVDDHEVLRIGLRTLFTEAGAFEVVGEAGTMASAVTEAFRLKPKVVLMDVRLPDGSGIDACRTIRTAHPDTRVLFLTSFANDEAVLSTILAGADGFLLKEVSGDQLIDAVKTVASGRSILDPSVTEQVLAKVRSLSTPAPADKREPLSAQEERVLALVADGKTNKEIAVALNLSDKTVGHYLENIFQKLQVSRRAQAAVYFTQQHPRQ
jgi:DNA-binding NarL/FixJ family response regulator